jgi:RNA polymerase sigma factor (TIGR02999 family)
MKEVTCILSNIVQGDPSAAGQLLLLVYDELRKLAAARLAHEKPGQTLQATALVHEAYLRLVQEDVPQGWNGRAHFFAAAAEAMRRILIEDARRKKRFKYGGDRTRIELNAELIGAKPSEDLLALDEALTKLKAKEPVVAKLVDLRYFGGMTIKEAADALGISPRTADLYWSYAKSWLLAELRADEP